MIRRSILLAILGLPLMSYGEKGSGYNNQLIPLFEAGNTIVINNLGEFVYNGTPALGNLVASFAPVAGTDSFGNAFQSGLTSYGSQGGGSTVPFAELTSGTLAFRDNVGANYLFEAVQEIGAPTFLFQVPGVGGPFNLFINTIANIVGSVGASGGPETWHPMAGGLTAGFAAGNPAPRYRFEPIGSGGIVRLGGVINLTANQASGNNIFPFPAAYKPASSQFYVCANNLSGAVNQSTALAVTSGGFLQLLVAGTNGNNFALDGITYSID